MPEPLHSFELWVLCGLTHETFWVAASAIFSAAVALATFLLARSTKQLASETVETLEEARLSRALADKHHQEALLPFVVIRAELSKSVTLQNEVYRCNYDFVGRVLNVGPGPAVAIGLSVLAAGEAPHFYAAAPMGGNTSVELNICWSVDIDQVSMNQSVSLPHPFGIRISYRSVFGTEGRTAQHSSSGRAEDLLQLDATEPPRPTNRV